MLKKADHNDDTAVMNESANGLKNDEELKPIIDVKEEEKNWK